MKRLNLKIGSKIAISAGIGILLVAGMVAGQHFSNAAIAVEAAFVNQNHFNKADAMAGAAAVQLNYVAVASIPSAGRPRRSIRSSRRCAPARPRPRVTSTPL